MPAAIEMLAPVFRTILTRMSRARLPRHSGELRLPGLNGAVEVLRDRWGVPHIYAGDAHDLFFTQGFVHAQDRLWQMELNRRLASGLLSEMIGPLALDTDRAARAFGFRRLALDDWAHVDPSLRSALLAYTEGVNAYLSHPEARMPVEFSLLRHKMGAWQPEDSLAFARLMIWQLSHAWYGEVVRARLVEKVGAEHAAEWEIHYPAGNPSILPQGIQFNQFLPEGSLQAVNGPFLTRGLGSNAWAIAGSRSASGMPLLSNDMHLPAILPALWYLVHLSGGNFNVSGVSLPGTPLVMVGHNDRLAWGMTLAFTDCEDLFVERFDPDNPDRYEFAGEWREAEVIEERIPVKGQSQPHVERVLVTQHGPVISDAIGQAGQRLAVCSMALRPCQAIRGWHDLNLARGWDDFVSAMRLIDAPQLSVAYADVDGNIGYWLSGRVPVRAAGRGDVPAPGWSGDHEWIDEVPFEEMPHALNPSEGYVVHTNNRPVGDDYPHYLGNVWMNGYRARRLAELIEAAEKLSIEDCQRMQVDFKCLPGLELARCLDGFSSDDPLEKQALARLHDWDGVLSAESVGGAIYEVLRYALVRNLLEPALGLELAEIVVGRAFNPVLMSTHEFYGHDTVALLRILGDADSWWISQAGGRQALLERSLAGAVRWLREQLGAQIDGWQWGKLHRITFPHALGLQKPLDQVFNRGPFPVGGDTDTPCQMAMLPNEPYDNKAWSPSFRQIVDLGDLSRSRVIVPPGQSGHLASPHYADLAGPWLRGENIPMLWTRQQVEQNAEAKLVIKP